jgi:phosphoribosylamine--glycine ligase
VQSLKILIVGAGGREHALAWTLAHSSSVAQIYVAPGNAGTEWSHDTNRAPSSNLAVAAEDIPALLTFALLEQIDLTVIGPEIPLSLGIVDVFQVAGMRVFGPTKATAQLETSKAFSKAFMLRHHIPTAAYGVFDDYEAACDFVDHFGKSVVVKADGLAAGKGVIVCDTSDQARAALAQIMLEREFGAAGNSVVIEERLNGAEISALAFCDGVNVAIMPLARDHKRIFDGDKGSNTGGMGAFAPVLDVPPHFAEMIQRSVLEPAVQGMAEEGMPYVGVLFAGLMLTPDGVKVLEFNCRFGDPETQVILPLLDADLAEILIACTEGHLEQHLPSWWQETCATVVLASPGYPGSYPKGLPIYGLSEQTDGVTVFHAGTALKDGQVVTAGGRVLAISGKGNSLVSALARAYRHIEHIQFEGIHYRHDIGRISEGITR